jgi:hypothetical protein
MVSLIFRGGSGTIFSKSETRIFNGSPSSDLPATIIAQMSLKQRIGDNVLTFHRF